MMIHTKEFKRSLFRKGLKRKWQWILLGIAVVMLGMGVFFLLRNNYNVRISSPKEENRKPAINFTVLKSRESLPMGTALNASAFELVTMDSSLLPDGAVREVSTLIGKRAAKEIGKNEILKASDMVEEYFFFKPEDRLMEQSFSPEGIPSDCKDGSIIDIRLFQPNGNDPVVLSKVFVMKRMENKLTMYMDPREQELLKQAVKEGSLYILLYADPNQEPSDVDYIPDYTAKDMNLAISNEDQTGGNQ